MPRRTISSEDLNADPLTAARGILGAEMVVTRADGDVRLRIVEVEAYGGPPGSAHPDPAAHSFPGPTPRNSVMFGPAGHLYVYRSYGIHLCVNVSCGADGSASAVLLRSGEVLDGADLVRRRRAPITDERRWAMGPGNLGSAVGIGLDDNGTDVLDPASPIRLERPSPRTRIPVSAGPRVGLTIATGREWRLWVTDSPAVSAFRLGSAAVRHRRAASRDGVRSVVTGENRLAAAAGDTEVSDW